MSNPVDVSANRYSYLEESGSGDGAVQLPEPEEPVFSPEGPV